MLDNFLYNIQLIPEIIKQDQFDHFISIVLELFPANNQLLESLVPFAQYSPQLQRSFTEFALNSDILVSSFESKTVPALSPFLLSDQFQLNIQDYFDSHPPNVTANNAPLLERLNQYLDLVESKALQIISQNLKIYFEKEKESQELISMGIEDFLSLKLEGSVTKYSKKILKISSENLKSNSEDPDSDTDSSSDSSSDDEISISTANRGSSAGQELDTQVETISKALKSLEEDVDSQIILFLDLVTDLNVRDSTIIEIIQSDSLSLMLPNIIQFSKWRYLDIFLKRLQNGHHKLAQALFSKLSEIDPESRLLDNFFSTNIKEDIFYFTSLILEINSSQNVKDAKFDPQTEAFQETTNQNFGSCIFEKASYELILKRKDQKLPLKTLERLLINEANLKPRELRKRFKKRS